MVFHLGDWPIQCQVFGHLSSLGDRLHLMEWGRKSNQILVGHHHRCANIVLVYLVGRTPLQMEGFATRLVFVSLLWWHAEFLLVP